MQSNFLLIIAGVAGGLLLLIIIAFLILRSKSNTGDYKTMKQLRKGTQERPFSADVMYQRIYIYLSKVPFIKTYLLKIRRKLEIIHIEDEYNTRKAAAKIMFKGIFLVVPLTIIIILLTKDDLLLLAILLMFEVFLIDTVMSGMVDKLDTKLLKQQVDFFAEIRHAYHEFNMVEEAIYETSQNDELEVSRQGERIYEILISDDPEMELEKYYDIAPNNYLKEFAGVSYLTKEFGDRTVDGASLYLKNLNNITEEMQLEILKREKLDYVFQSLSIISIVPVLFLTPLKNWAIGNFSFTTQFYDGKAGLIVKILLVLLTFVCYLLVKKIKDTGSVKDEYHDPSKVWQMKAYKKPFVKQIVDLFIPKVNTTEYRKIIRAMKDAASKQKMETLYVNRICLCIVIFIASIGFFSLAHQQALDYIYTQPVADYDILGELSEEDRASGLEVRAAYNEVTDALKGKSKITEEDVYEYISKHKFFKEYEEIELEGAAEDIYDELQIINKENFRWFELLLSFAFAWFGYYCPVFLLKLQKLLRSLEMENEVMQFQTIITMLMKIERVNVEIILEWIERYSNIFREPITKCVNNYEAGAFEALEELKEDISFPQLIRLVESLQAAVEKIPIEEAFDELDNEREYYQAKREESNTRLIARRALIGKAVGFAPLIGLFVGYLIVPLVLIGMTAMTESFATMSTMY